MLCARLLLSDIYLLVPVFSIHQAFPIHMYLSVVVFHVYTFPSTTDVPRQPLFDLTHHVAELRLSLFDEGGCQRLRQVRELQSRQERLRVCPQYQHIKVNGQ